MKPQGKKEDAASVVRLLTDLEAGKDLQRAHHGRMVQGGATMGGAAHAARSACPTGTGTALHHLP